jgi:hypothetical protein
VNDWALRFVRRRADGLSCALIALLCFAVFRSAPNLQFGDSQYAMLLAENLLRHGDLALERYDLPEHDYRLERVGGHRYYAYAPGTSLLSLPFVAIARSGGSSSIRPDGAYDARGELLLDSRLAFVLMAAFAAIVYCTARLVFPIPSSAGITLVAAFGTQVFSTASRAMCPDTWSLVLIGLAIFLLLKSMVRSERLNLPLLGTVEGAAYLVRPTATVVVLAATAVYVGVTRRKEIWQFLLPAAAWIGALAVYSRQVFEVFFPDYHDTRGLDFAAPVTGLLGNLVSPSRGLFVNVPVAAAIAFALVRYRRTIRLKRLMWLALAVVLGHLILIAGSTTWWGGHGYGARPTTNLVPWLAALGVVALDAFFAAGCIGRPADNAVAIGAGLLCVSSIAVNAVGAFSPDAARWNVMPENIDESPSRLWSWRRPQFLAPFVEPDGPFPLLPPNGLHAGAAEADEYLGLVWSSGEGEFRWTEGRGGATVRFSVPTVGAGVLELDVQPYLQPGKLSKQILIVSMNGRVVDALGIERGGFATYEVPVPGDAVRSHNVLRLYLPDAASPAEVEGGADTRELGIAARVIRWQQR